MNQKQKGIQTYGLWLLDIACISVTYQIATWVRFSNRNDWGSKHLHYATLVIFILVSTLYSFFRDWNGNFMQRGYRKEFFAVAKYIAVMFVTSLTFAFFLQWSYILSRTVIFNFAWMSFLLTYAVHIAYRKFLLKIYNNGTYASQVVIIAEKHQMKGIIENLQSQMWSMDYNIVGAAYADVKDIDADAEPEMICGVPVFAGYKNLTEKMVTLTFDEVFICAPNLPRDYIKPMVEGFKEMGVTTHYSLDIPEFGASGNTGKFCNHNVITYSGPDYSYKKMFIKRAIDICGAIVGLILTAIITVLVAPAIWLEDHGPVFFSQVRIGKNGRRFKIYKFRSMYMDAEERLKDLQVNNEMKGLMFKMENDPRVTKVGKFIRKTSLDEFPQFWNILKGDMSLVGTRPPTEKEFEQYNEYYRRRISMTPGLTGMWQVSGRSDIDDFDEVVKLDLEAIDNWSLALDFKILLMTIGAVFASKGAK
ncbi:sugar transferase [Butyrivibrio sp. XPD2002]|uniref:sugar transferase n=1 Tax=Butyrivibrio sp. XPD2002 TaxID=1280665 RepID=UPI000420E8EA|nr:sugar transferase [Butyrivibrio sp. XPD2002]